MTVRVFPSPLSKLEELEALRQAAKGCEEAKHRLIEHNLRLVAFVAYRFRDVRLEAEDAISIGSIGLIKAIDRFDLSRGIQFATYASRCIENEILMVLRKGKKLRHETSLEETVKQDQEGNATSLLECLGSEREQVTEQLERKEDNRHLLNALERLPEEERRLICYRYGIGTPEKKQKELADLFNISQSYVSRLEKKILKKLQHILSVSFDERGTVS